MLTPARRAAGASSPASGPAGAAEACTAAGAPVYVTNQLDDTLSVINGRTNQVTATLPAGNAPQSVAGAPGDRRVHHPAHGTGPGAGARHPARQNSGHL